MSQRIEFNEGTCFIIEGEEVKTVVLRSGKVYPLVVSPTHASEDPINNTTLFPYFPARWCLSYIQRFVI